MEFLSGIQDSGFGVRDSGFGVRDLTRQGLGSQVTRSLRKIIGLLLLKKKRVDVVLVGRVRMRTYNREFRNKDYATDVLSFPDSEQPLGDLIICPQVVRAHARRYGNTYRSELIFVLIHGVLHLLGYNHMQPAQRAIMERKERQLLKQFGYRDLRGA